MITMLYMLDERDELVPVDPADADVWSEWMWSTNRIVAQTASADGTIRVSTVFLGINHGPFDGPPIEWETKTLGGPDDPTVRDRYATRAEALAGHVRACAAVGLPCTLDPRRGNGPRRELDP